MGKMNAAEVDELAAQLERDERKHRQLNFYIGRRQREVLRGMKAREIRAVLVAYALRKWPERVAKYAA